LQNFVIFHYTKFCEIKKLFSEIRNKYFAKFRDWEISLTTLTRTQARTWTRTRTAIVYSTRALYENRFIKIFRDWLEMKLSNFYLCFSCFRYKRPTTGHRFAWVLTFFINYWKNKFNRSICVLGGADFWIFWIFNLRQPAADVKCYSKTKVEQAFFFISCHSLRKWHF
jgi:hypothetical protein